MISRPALLVVALLAAESLTAEQGKSDPAAVDPQRRFDAAVESGDPAAALAAAGASDSKESP